MADDRIDKIAREGAAMVGEFIIPFAEAVHAIKVAADTDRGVELTAVQAKALLRGMQILKEHRDD